MYSQRWRGSSRFSAVCTAPLRAPAVWLFHPWTRRPPVAHAPAHAGCARARRTPVTVKVKTSEYMRQWGSRGTEQILSNLDAWKKKKKKKCRIYHPNKIILKIAAKIQQWSYLYPYVVSFPSWTLWESPGLCMLYAIVHWQMHSIGWEDCVHDCNFNTPPGRQPLPSSEELSPFQEGGCCHAISLSWPNNHAVHNNTLM